MLGEKCLKGNERFLFSFISGLTKNCVYQTRINDNLIGVGGCSLAWGIIFCATWGFYFTWREVLESS